MIHNAAFDMKFLNAELAGAGLPLLDGARAIDTVQIARAKFPGAPASLDALCRRFGVDNSGREKHGALLDSEILAEVYLELIGGRQPDFGLSTEPHRAQTWHRRPDHGPRPTAPDPLAVALDGRGGVPRHDAFVAKLGAESVWAKRN